MFMYLLGFGMDIMFANFHMCGIMLYILVTFLSTGDPMCFRCLLFTLSGMWSCCFCHVLLHHGLELMGVFDSICKLFVE